MGTGYIRQDTGNLIANGQTTDAVVMDSELDAIEAAFHASTGHVHDGTTSEGGPITLMGPVQDFVVSATEIKPKTTNTLDIGTTSLRFKDAFLQGDITLGTIVFSDNAGTLEITGNGDISGTLDVGGAIVAVGSLTSVGITATGAVDFSGASSVAVPNSTTGSHALNVTTADARYPALTLVDSYLRESTVTGTGGTTITFTLDNTKKFHRIEGFTALEGGLDGLRISVSGDSGSTYATPVTMTTDNPLGDRHIYVRITIVISASDTSECFVDWVINYKTSGGSVCDIGGTFFDHGTSIDRVQFSPVLGTFEVTSPSSTLYLNDKELT